MKTSIGRYNKAVIKKLNAYRRDVKPGSISLSRTSVNEPFQGLDYLHDVANNGPRLKNLPGSGGAASRGLKSSTPSLRFFDKILVMHQ